MDQVRPDLAYAMFLHDYSVDDSGRPTLIAPRTSIEVWDERPPEPWFPVDCKMAIGFVSESSGTHLLTLNHIGPDGEIRLDEQPKPIVFATQRPQLVGVLGPFVMHVWAQGVQALEVRLDGHLHTTLRLDVRYRQKAFDPKANAVRLQN